MSSTPPRFYVKYTFYKVLPEWWQLPPGERSTAALQFQKTAESFSEGQFLRSYNLQGMRGDVDFMLWQVTRELEHIQDFATRVASTGLGQYLTTPHSYLAMTRQSQYIDEHRHEGQEGNGGVTRPVGSKYLIVYPFWKTRPWYLLSKEERQEMMNAHFKIGHQFPSVKINTGYSFGLDDQEFVVAFETDAPGDFLDLVAALRETETSLYTLRDTPIFTCINMGLKDILGGLSN